MVISGGAGAACCTARGVAGEAAPVRGAGCAATWRPAASSSRAGSSPRCSAKALTESEYLLSVNEMVYVL